MRYAFGPLIKKKQAITYIDNTLLQEQDKQEMFTAIREYHALLRKANLKSAPDKAKLLLRKIEFLGHKISKGTISPITARLADIQNLKSPESKTGVLSVLGAMGFYANCVVNYNIDAKPLYNLVNSETNFEWLDSHQQVFDKLKAKFAYNISLAIPNPKYPFHIHADFSNLATASILKQQFPEGKRIVSANSRVFDKAEQKMSPQYRERCGIITVLQIYQFYIIGSLYPLYLFCDHMPIILLWPRRGQLSHKLFKYQVLLTKFQNLKIIYTEGRNLAFPDLLSSQIRQEEARKLQIENKTVTKDIRFYTSDYKPINYSILHCDEK